MMRNLLKTWWWLFGLLLVLGVVLLSPLASPHPDGLERVAEDQGFAGRAEDAPYEVMPGYAVRGIENEGLATVVAGLAGTAVVFCLGAGLALLLRRRAGGEGT